MKSLKVSVIIPTFNRRERLPQAVESALMQEGAAIEVWIIDDGSQDGTREEVARLYGSDPRVHYHYQDNAGVSAARNCGLRKSQGDYIAFLDSDDVWLPGKIALQLSCLEKFPEAGMVWTDMDAVDANGNVVSPRYLRTMYRAYRWAGSLDSLFQKQDSIQAGKGSIPAYFGDVFSRMVLGNLVHTSTVLGRRERFQKIGFFREEYQKGGEDYEFHLRTCRAGPVAFVDAVTVRYLIGHPDAITRSENRAELARLFLETLTRTLADEKENIKLPPREIRQCLADAQAWLGREELVNGNHAQARSLLARSFISEPWRIGRLAYLAATFLPHGCISLIRKLKRSNAT